MEGHFAAALTEPGKLPVDGFSYLATNPGTFMSYWYGSLYTVIEGWRELGLHDPKIDQLLTSPNVEALRLFRNATFHYQSQWLHVKHHTFMASPDSVPWVRRLHAAFSRYFLAEMHRRYGKERT